eukprot:gene17234-18955_t
MALSKPFLSIEDEQQHTCLLCESLITRKCKYSTFKADGWPSVKDQAKKWSQLNIPGGQKAFPFTKVFKKIENQESPFGQAHINCRASFRTQIEKCLKRYGNMQSKKEQSVEEVSECSEEPECSNSGISRRSTSQYLFEKRLCFICNTRRVCDDKASWEGGLGRCSEERAAKKILERKELFLRDAGHRFFTAANRLQMMLGGESHDIFAVDLYYHKSCYLKFAFNPVEKQGLSSSMETSDSANNTVTAVWNELYRIVENKILRKRHAYLLHDILKDLKNLCLENGIEPVISHTAGLKRKLLEQFTEERLGFFPQGKYVIVYSQDTNPCEYSASTLLGHGLRDNDLIRSVARMIRNKIELVKDEEHSWPYTPNEVVEKLDSGPIRELYNLIYATINPNFKINSQGYAETRSELMATKVWSISSDWEALLVPKKKCAKQVLTGLTLHRITGSKEAVVMMNKMGNCISYHDIRLQNKAWAAMASQLAHQSPSRVI